MKISAVVGRLLARTRSRLQQLRAALRVPAGVDPSAPPEEKLRAWLEQNVGSDELAVRWQEWLRPGKWLLVYLLFGQVAGLTPLADMPLLLALVKAALALMLAARAVPVGLRYGKAMVRRHFLLKELIAQGDSADIGELLRLVEAELAALPWRPAPIAGSLLEQARDLLLRRGAAFVAGPTAVASRAVWAWIFGPTPPGDFPPYAEALLALVEAEPGAEHLPVLLDLRDLTAHRPSSPSEQSIPERAGKAIVRILEGMPEGREADSERTPSSGLAALLRNSMARNPVRRARAEQALLALGPDALAALRQMKHQPRWWWRLPAATSLLGLFTAWLVYREGLGLVDITQEFSFTRSITVVDWSVRLLGNQPWAAAVAVYFAFGLAGGLLGWVVTASSSQVRRLCHRTARGLSVMEDQEAAEGLLEVTRTLAKRDPAKPLTLQHRRRCARRLCWLSPVQASDALALHGDWFYKATEGNADTGFVRDMLAVIAHTGDPAARPLLRKWSRELKDERKEEAARLLAEIEERIARQGALVRPAAAVTDTANLLRVPRTMDSDTSGLLRPAAADAPAEDQAKAQPLNAASTEP